MSLISFYLKESPNTEGCWLNEILDWSNEVLEIAHDWVQWVFPTDEPSMFNADAPLVTKEIIDEWHRDKLLQHYLRQSYERWLKFCGIERNEAGTLHLPENQPHIWQQFNHNWLRTTRVLKSLRLLGLETEAYELYNFLDDLRAAGRMSVSQNAWAFWSAALEPEVGNVSLDTPNIDHGHSPGLTQS